MSDGKQATLDGGEADTRDPDEHATDDFGDELGEHETRGGYSRYDVASLLQKAVRRSDEECAAWAAWELVRSGYAWNCWDRLALYVVEDLRAGADVALTIDRYERLATERWDTDGWKGRLCAIHAALAAARATSTREATYAKTSTSSGWPRNGPRRARRAANRPTTFRSATSNRAASST